MTEQVSRYARDLEAAPRLLERLKASAAAEANLSEEVALGRTFLSQALNELARATAEGDAVPVGELRQVISLLRQVQTLVKDAAEIDAKKKDQALSAAHVLALLGGLRDDLCRRLRQAFGEPAAAIVDASFKAQPWTGHLDADAVRDALAAPISFDVKFRPIERGEDGTPREAPTALPTQGEALDTFLAEEDPDDAALRREEAQAETLHDRQDSAAD